MKCQFRSTAFAAMVVPLCAAAIPAAAQNGIAVKQVYELAGAVLLPAAVQHSRPTR